MSSAEHALRGLPSLHTAHEVRVQTHLPRFYTWMIFKAACANIIHYLPHNLSLVQTLLRQCSDTLNLKIHVLLLLTFWLSNEYCIWNTICKHFGNLSIFLNNFLLQSSPPKFPKVKTKISSKYLSLCSFLSHYFKKYSQGGKVGVSKSRPCNKFLLHIECHV